MSEAEDLEHQESKGDNRHEHYYFVDGSMVFQLCYENQPGILYKLHASVLGFRSIFFGGMFTLPRGPDVVDAVRTEGASDSNPILLPSDLSQQDFDHLLCYIYRGPTMHPKTDDFLVSILKLSTLFEIDDGVAHAVQELSLKGDNFHPALQFELARLYRVDHWIEPSFRKLMKKCITELDMYHMEQIGPAGYYWLTTTQAKIERHRKQFAFDTPLVVHDPQCQEPRSCRAAWEHEWTTNVSMLIHHPDVSMSLVEVLNLLRDTDIDHLCEGCRKLTVSWVWGTGQVTKEEDLIDAAIAALIALQPNEPIRATFRKDVASIEVPATI
ncbi:hypothetical protein DFH06DRAFT_536466 [Mycena polygramma]|nr:hypothetical protein DFH06DRAFT_536466 [Mycena polygramma]